MIEYRALLIECTPSAEPYFLCRVLFSVNLIDALYTMGLFMVYRALFRAHLKECRAHLMECRALLMECRAHMLECRVHFIECDRM